MPNPLIFLVAVVAIDLVLKSMRNKKKREKARSINMEPGKREVSQQNRNINREKTKETSRDRPIRELRKTLGEELNKARGFSEEAVEKPQETMDTMRKQDTRNGRIKAQREKVEEHSELEKMKRRKIEIQKSRDEYKEPIKQALVAKTEDEKKGFREDILKGIIFSEILGKPKSFRK